DTASTPSERPPQAPEQTERTDGAADAAGDGAAPNDPSGGATSSEPGEPGQAATAGGPAGAGSAKTSMFSSLKIRNYRLFAMGQAVSNTGTWMQRIAQDWLVHSLTGSATAVGITTALQFLPMLLFGLYGGVIADRCDKRKLLIGTQS